MAIDTKNTKNTRINKDTDFRRVVCKCGSKRIIAEVVGTEKQADQFNPEREGAGNWLMLSCAKCGRGLYYNGA